MTNVRAGGIISFATNSSRVNSSEMNEGGELRLNTQVMGGILRTGHALRRCVDRQAEQAGIELGGPHMRMLGYLAHHARGNICQKDLEAVFGLARSTVSGMLGQLEEQALIRREAVPGDARLKRVVLTEKAKEQQQRIEARMQQLEAGICRNFTEEECLQLVGYLDRVLENLALPGGGCCGGDPPRGEGCVERND